MASYIMKPLCLIDEILTIISKKLIPWGNSPCVWLKALKDRFEKLEITICKSLGIQWRRKILFRKIGRTHKSGKICASKFISSPQIWHKIYTLQKCFQPFPTYIMSGRNFRGSLLFIMAYNIQNNSQPSQLLR